MNEWGWVFRGGRTRWLRITATATFGLVVAGCSSSGGGSNGGATSAPPGGSGTTATSACVTKAENFVKPYDKAATTLPSHYTPLSKKPAAGKLAIQLAGPIPSDQAGFAQLQKATSLIGWQAKKINFAGNVEDLNSKFEQAISDKPAVIILSGYPVAALQKPLADAKAAGIVVALNSIPDQPTDTTGFAAVSNGVKTYQKQGEIQAYQFMADSKCSGSVLIANLPFPILKVGSDQFIKTVKANCPKCQVSESQLQQTDIGTPGATNAIVSALQSKPNTKYIFAIIANLAVGLPGALQQAGISGVKIFGAVPDESAIAALQNGTNAWWLEESSDQNLWLSLDAALRVLDTGKPTVDTGDYPLTVVTKGILPSNTSGGVPSFPLDYQQEFAKLWHAAG